MASFWQASHMSHSVSATAKQLEMEHLLDLQYEDNWPLPSVVYRWRHDPDSDQFHRAQDTPSPLRTRSETEPTPSVSSSDNIWEEGAAPALTTADLEEKEQSTSHRSQRLGESARDRPCVCPFPELCVKEHWAAPIHSGPHPHPTTDYSINTLNLVGLESIPSLGFLLRPALVSTPFQAKERHHGMTRSSRHRQMTHM